MIGVEEDDEAGERDDVHELVTPMDYILLKKLIIFSVSRISP